MANIKITDLNAIADPISTDVLPIVDVSADTTNKISIEELLKNAAAGTAALPAFAFDDDPDTGIYRTGADGLGFSTGGTGRLFIDSSGNIGVGAVSSGSKLEVYANDASSAGLLTLNQDGTGDATLDFVLTGTREYSLGIDNSDSDKFKLAGTAGVGTSDLLTITSSGDFGVGTTTPGARLHVAESGGATISLQDSSANNGVNYASIQADGTTALVLKASGGTTNKDIKLFTSTANERLRIDASGRLLHGYPTVISKLRDAQTTTNTRNASHQQVGNNSGDAGKAYLAYHSSNSSYYSPHIWLGKSASDTKGTDALVTSGTDLGNILFTGNDGSKFVNAARILAEVDGTAAADDMPGRLAFFTTPSGSDVPVQRLTIKNDGNVGVGTATPGARLDVARLGGNWTGAAPVSGTGLRVHNGNNAASSPAYIQLSAGNATFAGIYFGDDAGSSRGAVLYNNSGDYLQLNTSGNQRVHITSSGDVGIGSAAPNHRLQVTSSGTGSETVAAFGNANIANGLQIETNGNLNWGFNALNSRNLTFSTNQTEAARFDSTGRFIAGHSASVPTVIPGFATSYDTKTQLIGTNYNTNSWLSLARFGTSTSASGGAYLTLSKSNGATAGTHAAVNTNQHLGAIGFAASDGTKFVNAAHIAASAGGTVGTNQMSGQLLFYTNNSSQHSTERMRIDEDGFIGMGTTAPSLNLDIHNIDTEDTTLRVYNSNTGSSGDTILRSQIGGTTASNYIYFGDAHDNDVGRIRYLHSNNSLTFRVNAADALTIDSSQQVGIGTTTPGGGLEVKKDGTSQAIQVWRSDMGTNNRNVAFYSPDTDSVTEPFYWNTGNSFAWNIDAVEALRIDSSANVGIGTTSPTEKLAVNGNIEIVDAEGKIGFNVGDEYDSGFAHYGLSKKNGSLPVNLSGYYGLTFGTNGAERVRIDSSGRLLVGTSTARSNFYNSNDTTHLQLEATTYKGSALSLTRNSANAASGGLILGKTRGTSIGSNTVVQSGDEIGKISFQGADGSELVEGANIKAEIDGTPGADDMPGRLVFSTTANGAASTTERMRIDNAGKFLHFTSSNFQISNSGTSSAINAFLVRNNATAVGTGTTVCQIRQDGDIENTNNSYGAISDIKLKENIVDANSQWDDIKSLQIRKYNFKAETGYGTHTQIGLVAQETELVSPGLVETVPDCDEEGNDLGTTTKSVNYSVLYMKAVKALQEAMERIEQLEQRLTDAGL